MEIGFHTMISTNLSYFLLHYIRFSSLYSLNTRHSYLFVNSSGPKVNPILVEEVTLNPEAVAKKKKLPKAAPTVSKKPRASSTTKRTATKATGKTTKEIIPNEISLDGAAGPRALPSRIFRLSPQVQLPQFILNQVSLDLFSQHLIAGLQVLAVVKDVQDLELRVRFVSATFFFFTPFMSLTQTLLAVLLMA